MERTYGLGIDLGTTQTAAAVRDDGGQPSVVRLGGRRAEIPSLVFVKEDGGLLIGEAAERRGLAEPARLAREFKRRMGDPVPILVGGTPFSAHALTGKLLRHVLDEVTRIRDAPPSSLTLTHPANWGPYKREQFAQAVRLADAGEVTFRTEPEAAALQHATARRIAPGETVMVYDLGGGTFDVALLRRDGDGFTLVGEPEGIEQLGGADFDEAVFAHVVGALGDAATELDADDPEVVAALTRLRRDCVEAKESLSFDTETMIPVALPGLHTRVRLNRSELESMIAPSLEDTVAATRRAMRSAGLDAGQLSAILLAGGSSRIPIVGQLLGEEFGRPVIADPHAEHSVALGAAIATAAPATPNPTRVMPAATPPPRTPAGGQVAYSRGAASIPGSKPAEPLNPTRPFEAAAPLNSTAPFEAAEPAAASDPWAGADEVPTPVAVHYSPPQPAPVQHSAPPVQHSAPPVQHNAPPIQHSVPPQSAPQYAAQQSAPPYPPRPNTAPSFNGQSPYGKEKPTPPRSSRTTRRVALSAGLAVLLIVGGIAGFVIYNQQRDKGGQKAADSPSIAPSTPASPAPPYPTDVNILVRVDTGSSDRVSKVYSFKPGVGTPRTELAETEPGDTLPRWSHSRTLIAVTHNNAGSTSDVVIMNKDGSGRRTLVSGVTDGRVSWSGDDTKIAYVKQVAGVNQIFTIPVDGGQPTQMTSSGATKDDPFFTPDSLSIVYWVDRAGSKLIYALNAVKPKEPGRRITEPDEGPAVDPAVSPDHKWILFTREAADGNSDIWIVDKLKGGARRLTTNPEREMDPTWSPDGKWFAFTRGSYDKPTVVIMKMDGTDETVMTAAGDREAHPCWF